MQTARRVVLASVLIGTYLGPAGSAFADCPSLNMSKGVDQVAQSLASGSILVFLGKIERQRFVGDIKKIEDPNSDAAIDITYGVEDVFKGNAGSTITLRTPFFCEACSISNDKELKGALDADLGQRVIVYVADEIDRDGHRERVVSGGCPASLYPDQQLLAAFRRASRKDK